MGGRPWAVRLSMSDVTWRGTSVGRAITGGAMCMRRRLLRVADLLVPIAAASFRPLCLASVSGLATVCTRLDYLFSITAAKIHLSLVARTICVGGELLAYGRIIVAHTSAVLRIVTPMLYVRTAV